METRGGTPVVSTVWRDLTKWICERRSERRRVSSVGVEGRGSAERRRRWCSLEGVISSVAEVGGGGVDVSASRSGGDGEAAELMFVSVGSCGGRRERTLQVGVARRALMLSIEPSARRGRRGNFLVQSVPYWTARTSVRPE